MLKKIFRSLSKRKSQRTHATRKCRALLQLEPLENRALMAANILVTDAYLAQSNGTKVSVAAEGTRVNVQAEWNAQGLAANASYQAKLSIDGVPRTIQLTNGAGLPGVSHWVLNLGDWVVKPGAHTVTVQFDTTNTIAETNELDNSKSFQFTPIAFQSAYNPGQKFITPIAGTPYGNWTIVNYVDLNSDPGKTAVLDYRGGTRTYDGHDALDITLAGLQTPNRFISMDVGVPEYAAADGIVVDAHDGEFDRNTGNSATGPNYVVIDHGNGWTTSYLHMRKNSVAVKKGDVVKAGDTIGLVGSSGNSSDPHLHFGVRYNNMVVETYIDPSAYWVSPLPYAGDPPQNTAVLTQFSQHHITENGINADVKVAGGVDAKLVHYSTQNLTATAGVDYTASSGDLTFTPNSGTQDIFIPILNDFRHESNETFRVNFTDVTHETSWFEDWTIIDNDAIMNFNSVSGVITVNANTGIVNDTVTMDVSGSNVTIKVNNDLRSFPLNGPAGLVTTINIDTGDGNDTINVLGTPVNVTTNIHGGDGVDTFNVGAPGLLFSSLYSLSRIKGHLVVNADGGFNTLNIKDNDEFSSAHNYQVSAGSLTRESIAAIDFSLFSGVKLIAGSGDDNITVNSSNLFTPWSIDAGSGNDTIIGPSIDDTWLLTGNNSGKLDGNVTFVNVENLTGGNLKDSFIFSNGFGVTGKISGSGGVDTLDYGLYTTPVVVDLSNTKSTGDSSIASIETVVGGTSLTDTLIGSGFITTSTWNITASNAGTFAGNGIVLAFSQVENLTGSANPDAFVFSDGAFVQGIVDGGGGNNTIDYSAYLTAVAVNAASKTASATAGFANIQNFKGGQGTDTLTGLNFVNTFNITGSNAGNLAGQFTFAAFESLVGGALADSFVFSDGASLTGTIDGGSSADTLDYSAYTTAVNVDLQAGTATGVSAVTKIENVTGGSANDVIFGDLQDNVLKGNGGNDQLAGRAGADLLLGGAGNDHLNGGAGRNILIGGSGGDVLTGGSDDDLLIGGTTSYDDSLFTLSLMLAEWKRTDLDYVHRIADLRVTGVFGGQFKLDSANVIDDGVLDKLIGGLGQDWFWALGTDTTDKASGELVN